MRGWQIVSGIGLALLTGVIGSAAAAPQTSTDWTIPSLEIMKGQDGAPMVLIPAGPFTMGSNDGLPTERPEKIGTLDAYPTDQYEATLHFSRQFLAARKHDPRPTWD